MSPYRRPGDAFSGPTRGLREVCTYRNISAMAWLTAWYLVWVSPAVASAQTPLAGEAQAACVIRLGSKTLLVQDVWAQSYALPGGLVAKKESLAQAAAHQTQLATGLVVTPGAQLGMLGHLAVFDCHLQKPVDLLPRDVVLIPTQARYTTLQARFVDAATLEPKRWFSQAYAQGVLALCMAATPHGPEWTRASAVPTWPLFERELNLTRAVQNHMPEVLRGPVSSASMFGTEALICLAAVLVWCILGARWGLEFALYLMLVCLFNCLLKQGFQWPRPFYLDPRLQQASASSFGFPSGHTTCAASMALWTAYRALPRWRLVRGVLVLCVLSCSLSRVYLGVHFVHDVVGAWTEALVVWSLYTTWLKRCAEGYVPLLHWALASFGLASFTLWAKPEPDPVVFVCASAGLLIGGLVCKLEVAPAPRGHAAVLGILMVLGFVGIHHGMAYAMPSEATLMACVQLAVCSGVAQGFWMPLADRLTRRLAAIWR